MCVCFAWVGGKICVWWACDVIYIYMSGVGLGQFVDCVQDTCEHWRVCVFVHVKGGAV